MVSGPDGPRARRAVRRDAGDLADLRRTMLVEMGAPAVDLDAEWHAGTTAWFDRRLRDDVDLAAFVVEDGVGHVVSAAVGVVEARAPTGSNPTGLVGRVFNVATSADHRRRGLGRACVRSVLAWFVSETAVGDVELSATATGDGLYRSLGFRPPAHPTLRLELPRTRPASAGDPDGASGLVVRAAGPDDVDPVLDLWRAAAENESRPADSRAAVTALLDRDPDALLVASDGDLVVGSVVAGWDGWRAHLYRLAVRSDRRRTGVASALLDAAEARLAALGAIRFDAMVLDANDLGHHVWHRSGYRRQEDWSRWVKPVAVRE